MRWAITGVDDNGRSCLLQAGEFVFGQGADGVGVDHVYETTASPPAVPLPGHTEPLDLGVGPGLTRWTVVEWQPGAEFPAHHTHTIDFDIVLGGSIELILGDGSHELTQGDCVVVTGVEHTWRAGPDGCRLSVVALGTSAD